MAHPPQRTSARLANPGGVATHVPGQHYYSSQSAPPAIPSPSDVKKQLSQTVDYQNYARSVKKYLNGTISKTEFHAELAKILPSKDKLALHNWFILSLLKSAYSEYNSQRKGHQPGPSTATRKRASDLRGLSEYPAFKRRMTRTVTHNMLSGITDEAVSMVIIGLQQHLLRTLAALRSDVTVAPVIEDVPPNKQVLETSVPGDISANDINGAIWRRPTILCENQSVLQHRLSMDQC